MNPLSQYKEGGLPVEQTNLLRLISELEGSSQLCKWMGFTDDMETLDKMKRSIILCTSDSKETTHSLKWLSGKADDCNRLVVGSNPTWGFGRLAQR